MRVRAIAIAFFPVALLIVAVAVAVYFKARPAPDTLRIGRAAVHVELATTTAARERGLGGRGGLAPDSGMLFVFPDPAQHAFWMKDMRFAIDMVWLDAAGRVIYLQEDVSPATYPATFDAPAPSRYVLELPAGYARAHAVEGGDAARFEDGTALSLVPAQ